MRMIDEKMAQRIAGGMQRNDVFSLIPEGAERILDIGYGDGVLLLRLKYQKRCSQLYGVETNPAFFSRMEGELDGNWDCRIGPEDGHLGDEYLGFFNHIIMHDVLEHIYDPWMFLAFIRRYAAPGCRLILVCPNAQYWQTIFSLLHGDFPYGLDGHYNEDHIRWFTPKSMMEMALLAGLKVEECHLLLTSKINRELADFIGRNSEGKILPMPPEGIDYRPYVNSFPPVVDDLGREAGLDVLFRSGGTRGYLAFYAVKILLICTVAHLDDELEPLVVGGMRERRKLFMQRHAGAYSALLPREWKAYVWHPG
jgi:SAM-dependent methyltransferase